MSRLQKYKRQKKKKLVLMSKVVVAFYLLIFSFSYLTGGTIAYFSNSNQGYVNLTAGTWFDGSILQFDGRNEGTIVIKSCSVTEISANFKNVGHKMQGPAEYEVYYTGQESKGKGSPENHGKSIFKGEFNALDKDQVITLSYEAEQEGFYVFKVYQRDGFEPKGKYQEEIWSNKFKVQCNGNNGKDKQSEADKEQDTTESNEAIDEKSQKEEPVNKEKEVVNESTDETVESDPTQQDQSGDKNNQSNEQNDNAGEDMTEDNTKEETSEEAAANTNKQPTGEGESNEEID